MRTRSSGIPCCSRSKRAASSPSSAAISSRSLRTAADTLALCRGSPSGWRRALRVDVDSLAEAASLEAVATRHVATGGDPRQIYIKLALLLRDVGTLPVPAPLKQLAGIAPFKLFVSSTFDPLLARAINEVRFDGLDYTQVIAYAPREKVDIPADWEQSDRVVRLSPAREGVVDGRQLRGQRRGRARVRPLAPGPGPAAQPHQRAQREQPARDRLRLSGVAGPLLHPRGAPQPAAARAREDRFHRRRSRRTATPTWSHSCGTSRPARRSSPSRIRCGSSTSSRPAGRHACGRRRRRRPSKFR